MGLFKNFRAGYVNALEDQTADEIETIMKSIASTSPVRGATIIESFLNHRDGLHSWTSGWSHERKARFGREMQARGIKENRAAKSSEEEVNSYGMTLAGLWLQSSVATTEKAHIAFLTIESMIK